MLPATVCPREQVDATWRTHALREKRNLWEKLWRNLVELRDGPGR